MFTHGTQEVESGLSTIKWYLDKNVYNVLLKMKIFLL